MMKHNKLKISSFEIGYLIVLIARILSITTLHLYKILTLIEIVGYLIIATSVFQKRYSKRRLALMVLVVMVLAVSYFNSHDDLLLSIVLIGLSVKTINYRRVIYYDLIVRSSLTVGIMGLAKVGMLQNLTYTINNTFKKALGFAHPNHLGGMMFVIAIYYFYLRHKKFRILDYGVLLTTFYLAFFVAGSRTSAYLIILVIAFELLDSIVSVIPKIENVKSKVLSFSKYLIFIVPGASVWLAYNYRLTDPVMMGINSLLTGRLYLAYHAALNNPVTLFGSFFEYQGGINSTVTVELSNAIDNSYLYVLLHLGLIVFIAFIISLFVLLVYYLKTDRPAFLCLIVYMIGAFAEATMFDIAHNVFLVAVIPAFAYVFGKKRKQISRIRMKVGVFR